MGLGLQVWIRNPGPDSLPKTPAEPGLDIQPAHQPVESVPVAVCLPSLLNLNNSKGSYTEGQLWYCLFFQKQNKTKGWELQKSSFHMDVRSQSKTVALPSNHQTLPRSRLSFQAVTPPSAHWCPCVPDKASPAQRPGGHVFSPVTETSLQSPRENSRVRVPHSYQWVSKQSPNIAGGDRVH